MAVLLSHIPLNRFFSYMIFSVSIFIGTRSLLLTVNYYFLQKNPSVGFLGNWISWFNTLTLHWVNRVCSIALCMWPSTGWVVLFLWLFWSFLYQWKFLHWALYGDPELYLVVCSCVKLYSAAGSWCSCVSAAVEVTRLLSLVCTLYIVTHMYTPRDWQRQPCFHTIS